MKRAPDPSSITGDWNCEINLARFTATNKTREHKRKKAHTHIFSEPTWKDLRTSSYFYGSRRGAAFGRPSLKEQLDQRTFEHKLFFLEPFCACPFLCSQLKWGSFFSEKALVWSFSLPFLQSSSPIKERKAHLAVALGRNWFALLWMSFWLFIFNLKQTKLLSRRPF